jgi:hypothetical protein
MTSPGPRPGARPVATACFRAVRRCLAYGRGPERTLTALRGLRRETRLQLQAMHQLCHTLCE